MNYVERKRKEMKTAYAIILTLFVALCLTFGALITDTQAVEFKAEPKVNLDPVLKLNTDKICLNYNCTEYAVPVIIPTALSPLEQHWNSLTSKLVTVLESEEGFRSNPYLGPEGFIHVGFGTKLHNKKGLLPKDFPIKISRDLATEWLHSEVAIKDLRMSQGKYADIYSKLDEEKQAVILSMSYQLGTSGVKRFKKMWAALEVGDYDTAAVEMLDSRWARQTPQRAARHVRIMKGSDIDYVYSI